MKARYILEFQLIPKLVSLFNNRKAELFQVVDPNVWGELLRKVGMTGFSAKAYNKSFFRDENGRYYILISCPEPQFPTQVKYMVFVIKGASSLNMNGCEGTMEYFTLEKSLGFYAVCSPGEGFHSNCGTMEGEPTSMEFLRSISSGSQMFPVQCEYTTAASKSSSGTKIILLMCLVIAIVVAIIAII